MLFLWLLAYPMQADVKSLLRNGDVEAARKVLEDVLATRKLLTEDRVEALLDLAEVELLHREKPQLALARLLEVKNLRETRHPRLPAELEARWLYLWGLTQERLENYPEAARAYQEVAVRFPNSPYARDALEGAERVFRKTYEGWLARVEHTPITEVDLDEVIQSLPPFERMRYRDPRARKALLERLVAQELLYRAALDEGFLARSDVQEALERQKRKILVQMYLNEKVRNNVTVSETELREAYKRHQKQFVIPATAVIRKVVVSDSAKAAELFAHVQRGTPLDSLGLPVVEDRIRKTTKPSDLARAAFTAKPGEARMVQVGSSWVIFTVEKVEPRKVRPFEEVRNFLEGRLKALKIREKEQDLVRKLREQYRVVYNNAMEDTTGQEQDGSGS